MNLRRHLNTVRSVQSSFSAISQSLRPAPASSTIFARTTSRYGRVYCPARSSNSRRSTSPILRAAAATDPEIRRRYDDSFKPTERISRNRY